MGKLLIITGDLASGKSTFAQILSKKYHINVFCKDTIKEVLGETIGFSNREENLKLSKSTVELMIFLFSEFVKLDMNLILEANFHEEELRKLHQIAEKNNYEVTTLILQGDLHILHERYVNRMLNENRNPVHLSTNLDNYDEFKKYINAMRKEEVPGKKIIINVDDFTYQTDNEILEQINDFLQ